MISLTISLGGMPVDKMEESEDGKNCPLPTQDAEVNAENKEKAVEEANYGETSSFETEVCGNCAAFNQTDDLMACIGNDPDLGYCQMYKFTCNAKNSCDSWAEGGPIMDTDDGSDRDIL